MPGLFCFIYTAKWRSVIRIEIYYCAPWGYEPQAASLADELHSVFNVEVEMIKGVDGIFDVIVDGHRVFSRSETGRFPESGEIIRKLTDIGIWKRTGFAL